MAPDPRCAVRMRSDPKGRAGWWGSTCLPHFCLLGAPHSGADGLLNGLRAHPEVVAPAFHGLDFFAMGGPKYYHHDVVLIKMIQIHAVKTGFRPFLAIL